MLRIKKWPAKPQWRQFFKVLGRKEKIIFLVFLSLAVASFFSLSASFYLNQTEIVAAKGGCYTEGLVGSPRFINPIYAPAYDVDRDLTELIYSGLMKHDSKGKVVPDLVKEYKVLEEGKVYEFYLKENLLWQDTQPLTADDIVFTVKAVQNPSLKSPIRASWLGVTVEKTSELAVRFELKNPSSVFLENCTLKILPAHIWQDVSYQNFPLSIYNLKPIGSGPYKLKDLSRDSQGNIKSLELTANPSYSGEKPNIPKIKFIFFEEEKELIEAFNSREIQGFSLFSLSEYQDLKKDGFLEYHLSLPRYFALFFNEEEAKALAELEVRQALNYATDKEEIVNKLLLGNGEAAYSPVLPEIYGLEEPAGIYQFDQEKARQLLEEADFIQGENGLREKIIQKTPSFQFKSSLQVGSQGTEVRELQKCLANYPDVYPEGEITGYFGPKTKEAVINFQEKYKAEVLEPYGLTSGTGKVLASTRSKLNEICNPSSQENIPLSFTLTTVNQPLLKEVASLLKEQWRSVGIDLKIETLESSALEADIIKPRDYQILLFGEVLGAIPDPFPFWHSSQVANPGLNLAGYENAKCDKLLEEARQTLSEEKRKEKLEEFQSLLIADSPVVFLYNPAYLYFITDKIKGVTAEIITNPAKRFSDIESWYIKTKRVWR